MGSDGHKAEEIQLHGNVMAVVLQEHPDQMKVVKAKKGNS
jgi:hypothetical protein